MATYRGIDGAVTVGGTAVGEVTGYELNTSKPLLDKTALGASARRVTVDVPEAEGRINVNFDRGDTAQTTLLTQLLAGVEPTPVAMVLKVKGTNGELSFNAVVTSGQITNAGRGSLVAAVFSFAVDGAITVTWS